ncbi:hypothetical protein EMPS_10436 [Entomortierella parvispora]|uniref:G-protein coupled receptors family 2 profile 2 domain-containing protein n=1 Tax=Entomortierella parvispora TaxID=205924 RepID=A0A9P3HKV1_9FUNG|nr:hypothetical protein EMPS_10436 [Entomortierella parvispora]
MHREVLSPRRSRGKRALLLVCLVLLSTQTLTSWIPSVSAVVPTKTTAEAHPTGAAATTTTVASALATSTNQPTFILPIPSPTATVGNSTAAASCPPPLVPNIYKLVSASCMGACCLPCPASAVFYEPNKLENVYTITSAFRAVSATACALLAGAYLLLPNRRRHPHLIVLLFALLMVPWEGLGTAWLYKKEDLLCKNVYEIADMSNSWFCGVQGIGLQYIVLVMLCLAFFLISNLHFLTVYRSTFIQTHMSKLMVFSFLLPLSLVIPVAIRKKIENPGFGSICFVSSDAASAYFFYPLSAVVCLATLLHLGTIAFMIWASLKANNSSTTNHSLSTVSDSNSQQPTRRRLQTARDISQLLKQQWRPGLFALCLLIIDMIYWLFYFVEAKKLTTVQPTTPWFVNWTTCLAQQAMLSMKSGALTLNPTPAQFKAAGDAAQAACAPVAVKNVPNFVWAAASDMLPALFGIIILIIFGSKMELWQDLRTRLFGSRGGRVEIGGQSTKGGAKIMMKDVNHNSNNNSGQQQYPQKVPDRPHMDFKPYDQGVGFYDEDLLQNENPYSSQTNLAVTSGGPAFGGADAKMNSYNKNSSHQGGYRLDTPEPWKPTVWSSTGADQQDDLYSATFKTASPQLRINTQDYRPYQQTTIARALSPVSPSQSKQFYNSEDIDAAPISLTTPPPTYNNLHPRKTGQSSRSPSSPSSSRAFADGHGPVSPQRNAAVNIGEGQAIVAEASRVRLDYRISSDARQFMASTQLRQQPLFDPMDSTHRAMSPPPALPRKSMARQK